MDTLGKGAKTKSADSFVFWLAFALSISYLFVLALTILVQPVVASTPEGYVGVLNRSSLFSGPFQGVVTASLGAFFVKSEADGEHSSAK